MKSILTFFVAIIVALPAVAADTLDVNSTRCHADMHAFHPKQIIAPVALIGVGAIGSCIGDFKEIDFGLMGDNHHTDGFVAEDITQYIPAAGFYALKLGGVKSAHNYRDASVILAASYCITAAATKLIKVVADVERPNGKDNSSFPSGHSAVAFMGAEFLRMEYKDVSPWIGFAGYVVATGTALARIGHGEHWITDVLAGAGVGILGTKVAYWIYPPVQKLLFGKSMERNGEQMCSFIGLPYYNGESAGLSLALHF